jgi:hypothetical protein
MNAGAPLAVPVGRGAFPCIDVRLVRSEMATPPNGHFWWVRQTAGIWRRFMKIPAAVARVMGDAPERSGGAGRLVLPLDAAGEPMTQPNALRNLSAEGVRRAPGSALHFANAPMACCRPFTRKQLTSAESTRARERSWTSELRDPARDRSPGVLLGETRPLLSTAGYFGPSRRVWEGGFVVRGVHTPCMLAGETYPRALSVKLHPAHVGLRLPCIAVRRTGE